MVHKVIVQKRARDQFLALCDYLATEFGKRSADDFAFEVENGIATLKIFPDSGHPEPIESKYQYRSMIVGKYNKMYYFLQSNTLVIAAIADMRMHPFRVFRVT